MAARSFALDSNLMRQPTSRRLLHGIALETRQEIIVLPEVHRELRYKNEQIANVEVERWERRQKRDNIQVPEHVSTSIIKRVREAALQWYDDEIQRHDSPFQLLKVSEGDRHEIAQIAKSLPKTAFRDDFNIHTQEGDRLVVAQAIFFDVELLGSNNLKSIDHVEINEWLLSKGWNRALLHTPSETIESLAKERNGVQSAYRWLIAHAMNHYYDEEGKNRQEFLRTLDVLTGAGFRPRDRKPSDVFETIIFRIGNQFQHDHEFQKTLVETTKSTAHARKKALAMEIRLNDLVNSAVEKVLQNHTQRFDFQKQRSTHPTLER